MTALHVGNGGGFQLNLGASEVGAPRWPDLHACWTLDEAVKLVGRLTPRASQLGYVVAIYGSVAQGKSHAGDLDLLLFPKFDRAAERPEVVLRAIAQDLGAVASSTVRVAETDSMQLVQAVGVVLELPDTRLVDVQVRWR